jgi:hypothetical protein
MIPREITISIEVPTAELAKTLNAEARAVSGCDRRGHILSEAAPDCQSIFCSGKTPMNDNFEQAED